jgi:hypothetical protein
MCMELAQTCAQLQALVLLVLNLQGSSIFSIQYQSVKDSTTRVN